jgi:Ohr subfamily peroxiredoxin
MSVLYTASATSIGGRDGGVRSSDGILDLKVAMPKELGGQGGATNPEQLFAAGYAACFHSALKRVAANDKVNVRESRVTAEVGIGPVDGGFGLEVDLRVTLPGVAPDIADSLLHKAHQLCPYSIATRNNIPVRLHVVGDEPAAVTA